MTPVEQVTQVQEKMARAVASGAFTEAKRLLESHSAWAEQAFLELPQADREALAGRMLEFYNWATSLARVGRAQFCAQLRELSPPSPYHSLPAKSQQHWQYDA
jgi:hypothetical protein